MTSANSSPRARLKGIAAAPGQAVAPAWRWVWVPIGVVWFFVGCVLGLTGLAKLVSEKWKMGAARPPRAGVAHAPTDNKED